MLCYIFYRCQKAPPTQSLCNRLAYIKTIPIQNLGQNVLSIANIGGVIKFFFLKNPLIDQGIVCTHCIDFSLCKGSKKPTHAHNFYPNFKC